MTNPESNSVPEWLNRFQQNKGRPLRVLHIGNIANNAYNNAKLLNKAGLDCDVLCYDDYHIMACPEWEDADFDGNVEDQNRPDWTKLNLHGYTRPGWFAQGPMEICIAYLSSKNSGAAQRATVYWRALAAANRSQKKITSLNLSGLLLHLKVWLVPLAQSSRRHLDTLTNDPQILGRLKRRLEADTRVGGINRKAQFYLLAPLVFCAAWVCRNTRVNYRRAMQLLWQQGECLVGVFAERFPKRPDKLSPEDLKSYIVWLPSLLRLFKHYDIVQAYATDPILPLLANKHPYFAFEHGTLREIPAHATSQGRCAALSYSQATHVFVTNIDCMTVARQLAGDKVTFLNHPYDEDHGANVSGWLELREKLMRELDADFLFFFPTRHDWVAGTGYADKANDVFIRAFCRLRQNGKRVGMVCCRWGANVEQSRQLVEQAGYSKHVSWNEPMGIVRFERTAKAAHVVVDQFKLGAFGGVMFKAMSVGAPICTYLDKSEMARQFAESPPVINCRTEDDIVEKLEKLIGSQTALDDLAVAGRAWMKRYHSSADTVAAQLACYMKAL